ncbi:hypothetical protein APHWI1_0416 [Anaplasma phagocytophilum str. ApWI1]|uniref:Uncharacterized protein n=2 Tax=Anaplasma phagocytophilum TaxID=948 RepID=A0A0F3N512_ANAPH|nr:hypothetical protein APHWEB_1099 [Anaplasma phagocytophilum str. Webster]KJV63145.1 hypothetical protein EPHNCH_1235 [Anaplasma phagocytophilum str. NCH-1]KJV82678.1 hypothetical protein APHHGE2_1213 [Anaplasma phagocytophilum str. HGE2]KJV84813.1 hypothetical protein APHWI1_0416 [Anaplasma phagocytophilum str. ApWI1]KJV86960.1 hypothetical protein APHNYW_0926 [Anaplasma phagocytophilum str. ApNYW]KJV98213.1 hypothetical protein OTSANNIE_1185 [Anaplasma phagocytophilum str. Annie]KJZ99601.
MRAKAHHTTTALIEHGLGQGRVVSNAFASLGYCHSETLTELLRKAVQRFYA